MSQESEHEAPAGMSLKQAAYISIGLAFDYYIGYQAPPSKLIMSNWWAASGERPSIIIDEIKRAAEFQVSDPQAEIWKRLRRLDPKYSSGNAARRLRDDNRVRTWQSPQGAA